MRELYIYVSVYICVLTLIYGEVKDIIVALEWEKLMAINIHEVGNVLGSQRETYEALSLRV